MILLWIFVISSNEKVCSVSVRTLPREAILNESAVMVSLSGASQIATISWRPSVQYMCLTVTPLFLASFSTSVTWLILSFALRRPCLCCG